MAKMNKQAMMENMLTMPDIMKEFHTYKTGKQKAKYLREMGTLLGRHEKVASKENYG